MPSYQERSEINRRLAEQAYFDAKRKKIEPQKNDVRIGNMDGQTGRYQVFHADGGFSNNGVRTFDGTPPSDRFVRGQQNPNSNAIALGYRDYVRTTFVNRVGELEDTSFIGAGGGLIVGTDGDVVIPQFVPEGFIGYVWVGDISKTDDSHEYYAIYAKRTNGETEPPLYTMRFSHIVDGSEITHKEIPNIILGYFTDSVRSDKPPFTETNYGASFIVTGGVDGFFRFYTYSITYITNYNNSNFDEIIGFKNSSFQNGFVGFVDLNTNEANRFAVSIPDHVIPENTEENYFFLPEIQTPMPSPINTADGRFFFGQWGKESGQEYSVTLGTSDFIIARNNQYLFASNYRDYNLRFYNETTFTSVPTSFFQYNSPDPSPSFKVQFGNPYTSIQITGDGTIVRLLGITDDNLLVYITRAITDTEWSAFQEVEVPDFVDPPSFYETVYLESL